MGYRNTVIKGISWMSALRIVTRIFSYGKTAIIARILLPSQFGIFGIATLLLSFLEMVTETGINIFLIQSPEKIDKYLNSAWVVSILRGTIIGGLIIIFAPFIASFFNAPESRNVIYLISIVPFLRGFINPAVVTLQKHLQFGYEFWFRSTIFFIDSVLSVIFTLTYGVYGLVYGMLAGVIVELVLSFVLFSPRPRFVLEKNYFSEIFHKGKWITIYGIFNYFAHEGDNIVVGRFLGASSLGIYQMAYKISELPISEVSDVVSKVAFPVYAKIGGDIDRLKRAFIQSSALIFIATLSIGCVIFFFPREVVLILLGENWLAAVPVLQILAVYGTLRAISGSASALFLGVGKQNYVTVMTFSRFIGLASFIIPFVTYFGIIGAGYAALASVFVEIPVIIFFVYRIFQKG